MASMIGLRAPALEVKARWAFGELTSSRFRKMYAGIGPKQIHDTAAAKNPFSVLTADDHKTLAQMLDRARPERAAQVDASPLYRCEPWTKGQLAHAWALPDFHPPEKRRPLPYYDFYLGPPNTGPGGTPENTDPRVEAQRIPAGTPFNQFHEPVVVAGTPTQYLLLEGYFRSIMFMRAGDISQRLLAWVPYAPNPRPRRDKEAASAAASALGRI
jgi:hypothetical protein